MRAIGTHVMIFVGRIEYECGLELIRGLGVRPSIQELTSTYASMSPLYTVLSTCTPRLPLLRPQQPLYSSQRTTRTLSSTFISISPWLLMNARSGALRTFPGTGKVESMRGQCMRTLEGGKAELLVQLEITLLLRGDG